MRVDGFFQADRPAHQLGEPIWITLVLQNRGTEAVYLFPPRGRDAGLRISVREEGGYRMKDLTGEPEAGLVAEEELRPDEILRRRYLLTQWLTFLVPGEYTVQCAISIEVSNASIRQPDADRASSAVTVSTDLHFTILA